MEQASIPKAALLLSAKIFMLHLGRTIAANNKSLPKNIRRRDIVGGDTADPDRFPYYVRLDYDRLIGLGCGGSLIHRDFVLIVFR